MSGSSRVPPISSHPAFSKAVAVWFSALFGLSLLVLPHFAIEGMLDAVGLRGAIAFFAAPLSVAAHLTVCVFGAVVGALVGLAIARRLAGPAVSEEENFVGAASEPSIAESAEPEAALVQAPVAETPVAETPVAEAPFSEAQTEPTPPPVSETAEPEIAEKTPAPSTARGSIADRLASRVRASENLEPSISDDVAALAAGKEAREEAQEAQHTQAAEYEPVVEPSYQATEAVLDETVSSAETLLAKMPTIEHGDSWQSGQHADTSANADEDGQDVLNAADPLHDYDPLEDDATSIDTEEFEVEEVESFLEESLIEDEPSDDVSLEAPTAVETDEMQSTYYGFEGAPEEAPNQVAPAMSAGPELVQEAPPEFAAEPTDEPIHETRIAPEQVFEETAVESDTETAEAEAPEPDPFEANTSEAPKPETGRKPDLGQMLARLEGAIGSFETADETPQEPEGEGDIGGSRDDDPVVINLRQEAASSGAEGIAPSVENDTEEDPEESLRKALDRLTQVSGTA
ncbi:hypothetical protein ACRAQ7_04330 [Erythrobacter sp. W53]|uniref:hypothetical protein n=1 Tax=Erythrobacter sp. W53 TaxID=3425947 RepID=UPI003D76971A